MEIEGLFVEISYEYERGSDGDYWTAPSGDIVDIDSWSLVCDTREDYPEVSDEEWEEWMGFIDDYVEKDVMWDIIEFERDLDDI